MTDDQTPRHRACGTMQVHRRLLDTDPEYARRLARIEEHAYRARAGFAAMRPGCTLIPVVVHVVYKTAAQNKYQATSNRKGFEWLLTPLLLSQNYHLVHHLYPTVPFYRYLRVWRAREAFHRSRNPAQVSAFGVRSAR